MKISKIKLTKLELQKINYKRYECNLSKIDIHIQAHISIQLLKAHNIDSSCFFYFSRMLLKLLTVKFHI